MLSQVVMRSVFCITVNSGRPFLFYWGILAFAQLQRLAKGGPWRPLKGMEPVNQKKA